MTNTEHISAHADPENETPWAMQFVVHDTKDFTPLQLANAVATATSLFLTTIPNNYARGEAVQRWMEGRIRKILRRAKNSTWNNLESLSHETYTVEGVTIRVFDPSSMDAIPREISKCQVSHLKTLPEQTASVGPEDAMLRIYTNRSLNMSPAKAAVAAGHIAQLMGLELSLADYEKWQADGFRVRTSTLGSISDFEAGASSVSVYDAGFTEVEPGSITAVGIWTK